MVIWIVGMSGAGKTTLGRELAAQLRALEPNTVHVDGDQLRRLADRDAPADYTTEGRRRSAERLVALCSWLHGQGQNVVLSAISIFPDVLAANRERYPGYFEIYLRAPLEVLAARDDKGLYGPAMRGERDNVVGVDIPFPEPADPDMTIDTSGPRPDVAALAKDVLNRVLRP